MPITALTDLSLLPNKTMDQQAFDNAMAYLIRNLPLRGQQENELAANLNSIAMGSGFAIPYIFNPGDLAKTDTLISVNDPYSQSTTTNLFVNRISTNGVNYSPILNEFAGSTSALKGYARIVKQGDPSKFLVFAVLAVGTYDRYFQLSGVVIQGSQTNPFGINDAVLLTFTRTGDKGDTLTYPQLLIRDQQGSGTAGMSLGVGWYTRRFNFVGVNDIGASLSNNIVTIGVAGRYRVNAWASAANTNSHVIRLMNISTGQLLDVGSCEFSATNSNVPSRSTMTSIVTIAASTQLRIDHYAAAAGVGGIPVNNTNVVAEQFAEMLITKLT